MDNFTIVVPVFNECKNIEFLCNEILDSLIDCPVIYEVIFVNDGSIDDTDKKLEKIINLNKDIRLISHNKNIGQSSAILTGVKNANYNTVVTIDGDRQNIPKDIIKLLKIFFSSEDIKLVSGIRINRRDNIIKILTSKIANFVRASILKDKCPDTGCGLKVFSKKIFLQIPFFNGIHRFLPALFRGFGYNVSYVEVGHRKRVEGKTKYGTLDRLFKGIIDIIRVKTIINKINKYDK